MPKIKPKSSRRAPPLKDSDYDHEITLVDHAAALAPRRTRSAESEAGPSLRASTTEPLIPGGGTSPSSPERQTHDAPQPQGGGPASPRDARLTLEVAVQGTWSKTQVQEWPVLTLQSRTDAGRTTQHPRCPAETLGVLPRAGERD